MKPCRKIGYLKYFSKYTFQVPLTAFFYRLSETGIIFICFYFIHFSKLNSISIILFWENTRSASKNYQIILIIPVCNLTLNLTLPYFSPYLTLPYVLPYHTVCHTSPYLTYVLPCFALPYLTLPHHTLCLTLPYTVHYLTPYLILP